MSGSGNNQNSSFATGNLPGQGYTTMYGRPISGTSTMAQPGQYTPYQDPEWLQKGLNASNQPLTNANVTNFGRWGYQNGATNGYGMTGPGWPSPQSLFGNVPGQQPPGQPPPGGGQPPGGQPTGDNFNLPGHGNAQFNPAGWTPDQGFNAPGMFRAYRNDPTFAAGVNDAYKNQFNGLSGQDQFNFYNANRNIGNQLGTQLGVNNSWINQYAPGGSGQGSAGLTPGQQFGTPMRAPGSGPGGGTGLGAQLTSQNSYGGAPIDGQQPPTDLTRQNRTRRRLLG